MQRVGDRPLRVGASLQPDLVFRTISGGHEQRQTVLRRQEVRAHESPGFADAMNDAIMIDQRARYPVPTAGT